MKVSVRWLREFVDFDLPVEKLASKLTDAGVEVAAITPVGKNMDRVVVGEIVKVSRHPRADKLSVCEVTTGSEKLQIVCGAPNVAEKAKVAVALIGARLPGGIEISKSSLRGVDSLGMICSEKELGVGEDEEGIMILEPDRNLGQSVASVLKLEDHILDLDLTPNRPDCLCIVGVAREVAALCGSQLKRPDIRLHEVSPPAKDSIRVEIEDPRGCPRYAARVIKDVRIKDSPLWMKSKLYSAGMRPINNVVDIANLVMLELGHPLHAFDYELFKQKKVVVRRARDGESFVTLDQMERSLNREVLLITDGKDPVAIAGIMGGLASEVSPNTQTVLLESAYFDPRVIRRGRMFLGVCTESSQRFERGADPNGVVKAIDRAAELLEKFAGGKVLKGVIDNYPNPIHPVQITLRPQRVNKILSTDLKPGKIRDILASLELLIQQNRDFQVEVPTFRPDLTREMDLIEEVARIYGYGNIKTTLLARGNLLTQVQWQDELARRTKQFMAGEGFFEVITNNLVDPDVLARLDPGVSPVEIKNPLSRDLSVLSTTLLYNLLSVVSRNRNRMERDLRIFELGKVFFAGQNRPPEEELHLGMAISGSRAPRHWESQEADADLFDLKGTLEGMFDQFSLNFDLYPQKVSVLEEDRSLQVRIGQDKIGVLGEVSREILEVFGIKEGVFWSELDFGKIMGRVPREKQLSSLPKFPPADRDLAVVVDETLLSRSIGDKIKEVGGSLIENITLFDVYKGRQIPAGKKSLAYSIRYRSQERTLTDEEVDKMHRKVILELKKAFGASLRE